LGKLDFGRPPTKEDFGVPSPSSFELLAKTISAAKKPAVNMPASVIKPLGATPSSKTILPTRSDVAKPLSAKPDAGHANPKTDRRPVPGINKMLVVTKPVRRGYTLEFGGRSLNEQQARAACSKAIAERRVTADEATRMEGYFNARRQLTKGLAAKLFV
jgi:hypothetical protein